MGQAKQRGTFEERQILALNRKLHEKAEESLKKAADEKLLEEYLSAKLADEQAKLEGKPGLPVGG